MDFNHHYIFTFNNSFMADTFEEILIRHEIYHNRGMALRDDKVVSTISFNAENRKLPLGILYLVNHVDEDIKLLRNLGILGIDISSR